MMKSSRIRCSSSGEGKKAVSLAGSMEYVGRSLLSSSGGQTHSSTATILNQCKDLFLCDSVISLALTSKSMFSPTI